MHHENDGGPSRRPPSPGGQPNTWDRRVHVCEVVAIWSVFPFQPLSADVFLLLLPDLVSSSSSSLKLSSLCAALQTSNVVQKVEEFPQLTSSSYLSVFLSVRHSDQLSFFQSMDRREPTFPGTKLHGGQISAVRVKLLMERPRPPLFSPPRLPAEGHWEKTEISADSLCISTQDGVTAGVQTGSPGP